MNKSQELFYRQQGGMESLLSTVLPFLLIIVVFYFLISKAPAEKTKGKTETS